jgi:hypothetical protein
MASPSIIIERPSACEPTSADQPSEELLPVPAGYDSAALFCDEQARPVMIVLSTALLALAFCLFCRAPSNGVVHPSPE